MRVQLQETMNICDVADCSLIYLKTLFKLGPYSFLFAASIENDELGKDMEGRGRSLIL